MVESEVKKHSWDLHGYKTLNLIFAYVAVPCRNLRLFRRVFDRIAVFEVLCR